MRVLGLIGATAILAIGCVTSQFGAQAASRPDKQDTLFATAAASGDRTEVELGKLAASRATDPEVKQFAQRMADEHGQMSKELATLMKGLNLDVSDTLPAETKADLNRLSKLSSSAFDSEYMKFMVTAHDKAKTDFANESQAGTNEQLKKFASNYLPTIREHLDQAVKLDGKLATAAGTPATQPQQSDQKASQNAAKSESNKPIAERTAADLTALPVITPKGDLVGNIKEIVLDHPTGAVLAVVPIGSAIARAWGIGARDIAIDCRELRSRSSSDRKGPNNSVIVNASEEELKSRPAIDVADKRYVKYPDNRKLGELGQL